MKTKSKARLQAMKDINKEFGVINNLVCKRNIKSLLEPKYQILHLS